MKYLSERAAWALLADCWAAEPDNDLTALGLCHSLKCLYYRRRIGARVYRDMQSDLLKHGPPRLAGWQWWRGDRAPRAAFCRAMVRRLAPRKARKV